MKNNFLARTGMALLFGAAAVIMPGCADKSTDPPEPDNSLPSNLGWMGQESDKLEQDIRPTFASSTSTTLPSKVDLVPYFPPIGNQGQYGTCVAWATAYNLKTYLEGRDRKWTSSDLANTAHQFSPKDLFYSIDPAKKGDDCNGTYFEAALDNLVSRGVATLATAPYNDLGNCSGSSASNWSTEASNYRLDNYREIDFSDVAALKKYIADGRPIVIGAKLGENFMSWNTDEVLSTDTKDYKGQHANHAMIVAGYDDSKNAFHVVNSWGTDWASAGRIWVDYNFFATDWCYSAFVASNSKSNPDQDNDNTVDPGNLSTGDDLACWDLVDNEYGTGDSRDREVLYDAYNVGTSTITADKRWSIIYAYYNAYDADDWGILLYDYYTDEYASVAAGTNEELTSTIEPDAAYRPGLNNWVNNIDIPSGSSAANVINGTNNFSWPYTMPAISGDYYLFLMADGFDAITEYDETNNFYFMTDVNGDPISFSNGYILSTMRKGNLRKTTPELHAKSPSPTAKNSKNVNAYSPSEIKKMMEDHRKSGELARRVRQFTATQKSIKKAKK